MKKMKKKIFNFVSFIYIVIKVTSLDSFILPQAEYSVFRVTSLIIQNHYGRHDGSQDLTFV